jgi:hypothetical protein
MPVPTTGDWLVRAEEARALASQLVDSGARQTMLEIAEGYEKLARHAAQRAKKSPTGDQTDR